MIVTLLLGGAGDGYPLVGAVVQLASLILLGLIAFDTPNSPRLGALAIGGLVLLCAAIALPLVQMIPLPEGLWQHVAGRQIANGVWSAIGAPPHWRPLTLDPGYTFDATLEMLPALAVFLVGSRLDREGQFRLVRIIVAVGIVSAVLGVFQKSLGLAEIFAQDHAASGPGLFVNRNHQATLLLIAILLSPITVPAIAPNLRGPARSALTSAVLLLLSGGVIATTSRAGLFLLAPALAVAMMLMFRVRMRAIPLLAVASGMALCIAVALQIEAVQVVISRYAQIDERQLYWRDSWPAIRAFWPLGSGIGTFTRVFPAYESDALVGSATINAAHNDYVQLLMEGGLAAAVLIAVGFALLCWAIVRLARAKVRDPRLGWAAAAAIAIIMAHSVLDYPLRMMSLMAVIGLLLAVLVTADRMPVQTGKRTRRKTGHILSRIIAASAIMVGIALVIVSALDRRAETSAATVALRPEGTKFSSAVLVAEGNAALLGGKIKVADAKAVRALDLSPLDDHALELLVRVRDAEGRWGDEDRLAALSTGLTKRNLPLRFMAMTTAARNGAMVQAVREADLLLRQNGFEDQTYAYLRAVSAYPRGRAAIIRHLIDRPRWRDQFLPGQRALMPGGYRDFALIFRGLSRTSAPPSATESGPFAQTLVKAGDTATLRSLRDSLSGGFGGLKILDPTFAKAGDNAGGLLGWTLPQGVAGLDIGHDGLPVGDYGSGAIAEQILFLPIGHTVLHWQERGFSGTPDLRWAIRCIRVDAPPKLGLVSMVVKADATLKAQPIDVPAGCGAQKLTLYYVTTGEDASSGRLTDVTVGGR